MAPQGGQAVAPTQPPAPTPVPARVASYTVAGWGGLCADLRNCSIPLSPAGNCVNQNPNCPAPGNAIPDGGSVRECNANRLFVWIKLSNVQVPTNLTVQWYVPPGRTSISGGSYRETDGEHLFWASLGRSIIPGTYTVELRADGNLVKTATLNVTC
jgi:hypothetical protein